MKKLLSNFDIAKRRQSPTCCQLRSLRMRTLAEEISKDFSYVRRIHQTYIFGLVCMHELLVYYMVDVIDTVYLVGIHR